MLTRSHLPYRLAVNGTDRRALVERLRGIADRGSNPVHVTGDRLGWRTRVAFVFSRQGSQWLGMARELLAVVGRGSPGCSAANP